MPSSKPAASQPEMSIQAAPLSWRILPASSVSGMKALSWGHRYSVEPTCLTWPE